MMALYTLCLSVFISLLSVEAAEWYIFSDPLWSTTWALTDDWDVVDASYIEYFDGCPISDTCLQIRASGEASVSMMTTLYSSIELRFRLSLSMEDPRDRCQVFYKPTAFTSWLLLSEYGNMTDIQDEFDVALLLPPNANDTSIDIRFVNAGRFSTDACYLMLVSVYGEVHARFTPKIVRTGSHFVANESFVFYNDTLVCDDGVDCLVECTGDSSNSARNPCEKAVILCPAHASCTVRCDGGRDSACKNVVIQCPIDAQCNVECADYRACEYPTIMWPGAPELASLACTTDSWGQSCKGVLYPPVDDATPFFLVCSQDSECAGWTIRCPVSASCFVQCLSYNACEGTNIIWSETPGLGSLICNDDYSCAGVIFPPVDDNTPTTFLCDSRSECSNALIRCPSNADCTVMCSDYGSCEATTIIWPTNPSVQKQLICNAASEYDTPCGGTTAAPTYISSSDNDTDLVVTLTCDDYYDVPCGGQVIQCPLNAGCFVTCSRSYVCNGVRVQWIKGQPHELVCGGYTKACAGINFEPEDNIAFSQTCSGRWQCAFATFECPRNADCMVSCTDDSSCRGATIIGPRGHALHVVCTEGCQQITIDARGSSSFTFETDDECCDGATMHLPESEHIGHEWNTANISNAHLLAGGSAINYCGSDFFSATCTISANAHSCQVTEFDVSRCPLPTFEPTREPTVLPTTTPTIDPSTDPTAEPTVEPTMNPSVDPTSVPTFSPTFDPTVAPTIVCGNLDAKYLNTSFEMLTPRQACNTSIAALTLELMDALDIVYAELGIILSSYIPTTTAMNHEQQEGSCGNTTIGIISCVQDIGRNEMTAQGIQRLQPNITNEVNQYLLSSSEGNFTQIAARFQYLHTVGFLDFSTTSNEEGGEDERSSQATDDVSGYLVIALVFLIPLILVVIAWRFHKKRKGSDKPNFVAIFAFFINVADFYTDALFAFTLLSQANPLWLWAAVFSFLPHSISILVGFFYFSKWRQATHKMHIKDYAERYDVLLILPIMFAGFYATLNLATSHLFHLPIFSLPIGKATETRITNLKIINTVLLENVPLFYIQVAYLSQTATGSLFGAGLNITLLAMTFSITAIGFGVLTILLRCVNGCIDCARDSELNSIMIEFELTSDEAAGIFQPHHVHTRNIFSKSISTALQIQLSQAQVVYVKGQGSGLKVRAKLRYLEGLQAMQLEKELNNQEGQLLAILRTGCLHLLEIPQSQWVAVELKLGLMVADINSPTPKPEPIQSVSSYEVDTDEPRMHSPRLPGAPTLNFEKHIELQKQ